MHLARAVVREIDEPLKVVEELQAGVESEIASELEVHWELEAHVQRLQRMVLCVSCQLCPAKSSELRRS